MYIKTTRPTEDSEKTYESVINYVENLKEEISFMLEILNKKADLLQAAINEMRGESQ